MPHYTALVVDDEAAMRTLYEMVLKAIGFHVLHAADGEQGLEMLHTGGLDVVFLDMLLPKHDGSAILDYRAATPGLHDTPFVIVSAHSHFRRSLPLGPLDQFLLKPVRPNQIRDAALGAVGSRA